MADDTLYRVWRNSAGRPYDIFERNTHFIIVNYQPLDENEQIPRIRKHMLKCDRVRQFFIDCTEAVVHDIQMNPGDDANDFNDRLKPLIQALGLGDLVILYYHGLAGNSGTGYTWNFEGVQSVQINAFDLVKGINQTNADCLLLLDCHFQTRRRPKWDRKKTGNIEVVARGLQLQDQYGRVSGGDADFTEVMVSTMETLLEANRSGRYEGTAPRSFPHVMTFDEKIASNPLRGWQKRPQKGSSRVIKRIMVWPPDIRMRGVGRKFLPRIQNSSVEQDDSDEAEDPEEPDELEEENEPVGERKIRFFAVKIQGDKGSLGSGHGGGNDDEGFDEPDEFPDRVEHEVLDHRANHGQPPGDGVEMWEDNSTLVDENEDHSAFATNWIGSPPAHSTYDHEVPVDGDVDTRDSEYPPLPDITGDSGHETTLFVPQNPYFTD